MEHFHLSKSIPLDFTRTSLESALYSTTLCARCDLKSVTETCPTIKDRKFLPIPLVIERKLFLQMRHRLLQAELWVAFGVRKGHVVSFS